MAEQINRHKEYWSYVGGAIYEWIFGHKKLSLTLIAVSLLLLGVIFGAVRYLPEFSFPFGTFQILSTTNIPAQSQVLDKSIFLIAYDLGNSDRTSNEKSKFVQNLSGLHTKSEVGTIMDVWTDNLTLTLRGAGDSGESNGYVACNFSSEWRQKLDTYSKGDQIHFTGIVDYLYLSTGLILLNNCQILPD